MKPKYYGQLSEIAKKCGVSVSTISLIYSGGRKPSVKLAKKLQKITGKAWYRWLE